MRVLARCDCAEKKMPVTLAAIGERFDDLHYASVNTAIQRLKAATTDDELAHWRRRILDELSATS